MSLTELNLNKAPNPKSVNFADRNAVEKFLETEKFRPCASLACRGVELPHEVLYMPVCHEGRFNREGVAEFYDMPRPPRPLSPLTYTDIGIWAPLVSCSPDCKGYRNRTVAKAQQAGGRAGIWLFERILKPAEFLWAAFWAWLLK